jgi:hypothetical protein
VNRLAPRLKRQGRKLFDTIKQRGGAAAARGPYQEGQRWGNGAKQRWRAGHSSSVLLIGNILSSMKTLEAPLSRMKGPMPAKKNGSK